MSTFERVSRDVKHDYGFFAVARDTIHEASQDETFTRYVVTHIGAVAVVPVLDNGDIMLIKQYRGTIDELSLEAVAGRRDVDDEDVVQCAQRELGEEIGLQASSIVPLGWIHTSPGFTNERIYLFMATGCAELDEQNHDGIEEQLATRVRCSIGEALQWINNGTITDAKSIVNIYRVAQACGKLELPGK